MKKHLPCIAGRYPMPDGSRRNYSRRWFLRRFYFYDNFHDRKWRRQHIHTGHPAYRRGRNVHPAFYFSASRSEYNIRKWWRWEWWHDGRVPTADLRYSAFNENASRLSNGNRTLASANRLALSPDDLLDWV
jgi:hypothetical protein